MSDVASANSPHHARCILLSISVRRFKDFQNLLCDQLGLLMIKKEPLPFSFSVGKHRLLSGRRRGMGGFLSAVGKPVLTHIIARPHGDPPAKSPINIWLAAL